jgi:squalene cyclase
MIEARVTIPVPYIITLPPLVVSDTQGSAVAPSRAFTTSELSQPTVQRNGRFLKAQSKPGGISVDSQVERRKCNKRILLRYHYNEP